MVYWKNSSNLIIISGGRFEVFSNGILVINNLLKIDDRSLYICEVVNLYGIIVVSVILFVGGMWCLICKE